MNEIILNGPRWIIFIITSNIKKRLKANQGFKIGLTERFRNGLLGSAEKFQPCSSLILLETKLSIFMPIAIPSGLTHPHVRRERSVTEQIKLNNNGQRKHLSPLNRSNAGFGLIFLSECRLFAYLLNGA